VTVRSAAKLDIDHVVPLAEAWQSGAWRWSTATRTRYANDLGYRPSLIAVTAHTNRSKGDREPQSWLPPRKSLDCRYLSWWVAVKWRWRLTVDRPEKRFLVGHLRSCGWPKVAKPRRATGAPANGGGSLPAAAYVDITDLQYDSPGSDDGSNASRNAEWIKLTNRGDRAVSLSGWTITDEQDHVYTFPSSSLAAHASVRVHSGDGTDTASDRYWGSSTYIWNNSGDAATLRTASGQMVAEYGYSGVSRP
jgi:hypothetical protein